MRALRSLSMVMPAYNEAANVQSAIWGCATAGSTHADEIEIIVVDDGSQDDTAALANAMKEKVTCAVRVLRHDRNEGYGAALRTGLRHATMRYLFFTDADLQFDLRDLGILVRHAQTFDVVVGYRAPRRDSALRCVYGWAWSRLVDGLFDLRVRDVDCAFKLFHRGVLQDCPLVSDGALINAELLARAKAAGFRVGEVPVRHLPRRAGHASGARLSVILQAFWELGALHGELRRWT